MKKATLFLLNALAACGVGQATDLQLTFARTGNDAAGVTVTADGTEGANATVISLSHSLKALNDGSIICPDVNGNTNPTISMTLSVTGLEAGTKFNKLGLHIHAMNASGGYQQSNDNKTRQWNVTADVNSSQFATFANIDIAAGITGCHKLWEADAATITATDPLTITITITKGTTNEGCFFGLSAINLSFDEQAVEPPVEPVDPPTPGSDSKFYTVRWKNNTSSFMSEQADGRIAITDYDVTKPIFWEFIPTDNENCYYIRSVASGKYIGSCNLEPSSNSKVRMSDTPVEYYVGATASTSGENAGCHWLSSTDCANFSTETSSTRALNKDGASDYIITWTNGANGANKGSYWTLTESENLYEPRPFNPVADIASPAGRFYRICNPQGMAYSNDGSWQQAGESDNLRWFFVGTDNKTGGYQIVSAAGNAPAENGARFTIHNAGSLYCFKNAISGDTLTLAGEKFFTFAQCRSAFSLLNRLYQMPCGTIGDVFITAATIGSDFHYPMASKSGSNLTYPAGARNKYVILTRDAATLFAGAEAEVTVTLNRTPGNHTLIMFADWNRDGVFEHSQQLAIDGTTTQATLAVPADAAIGQTRVRLRLNSNGLNGADNDVSGQIIDLMINVCSPSTEFINPEVGVNDPTRGTAVWADNTATATPMGTSVFLYWREGPARMVSLDPSFGVSASPLPRKLTAVFTVNLDELSGIDFTAIDTKAVIGYNGSEITVGNARCKNIYLFSLSGALTAASTGNSLDVSALPAGIYIVKAVTDNGTVTSKITI